MPDRKVLEYRYGYNDQETDPETGWQAYTFREYDARIARFFRVDPLMKDYPFWTPYQFAGNNPVANKELEGAEPQNATQSTEFIDPSFWSDGNILSNWAPELLVTASSVAISSTSAKTTRKNTKTGLDIVDYSQFIGSSAIGLPDIAKKLTKWRNLPINRVPVHTPLGTTFISKGAAKTIVGTTKTLGRFTLGAGVVISTIQRTNGEIDDYEYGQDLVLAGIGTLGAPGFLTATTLKVLIELEKRQESVPRDYSIYARIDATFVRPALIPVNPNE